MNYVSVRSLVTGKRLGEFSTGARPVTYATVLRRVGEHIKSGNQIGFLVVGHDRTARYAIPEEKIELLINLLTEYYARD